MDKLFFKIALIFCISLNLFGQTTPLNKSYILKQQQLIIDFPKDIKNSADFNKAIEAIKKFNLNLLNNYVFVNDAKKLLKPLQNTILWAEKNTLLNDKMACNKIYFLLNEYFMNYAEKIKTVNDLLLNKELLTKNEIYRLLTALQSGYFKLESYNDIIRIIPERKKYAYLDTKDDTNATIEYDLAIAYYNTKNYNAAINSFLVRKKYYQKYKENLYISSMSNNIGLCYFKLKNNNQAKFYFKLALDELKLTNNEENKSKNQGYNTFFEAVIQSNIAKIDIINENYSKAIKAYSNLVQKTKIAGEKNNIPESYLDLAKINFKINNISLAEIYLDSAKNNFLNALNVEKKIDYLNTRGKILLAKGKINEALILFELGNKTSDSILNLQANRNNILAQVKYNTEEKNKALQLIKIDLLTKERIATGLKIAFVVTLILLSVIAVLFFKNFKSRKLIDKQNIVLKENLTEKEVLLKEIHHRVKNNLQVISGLLELQAKKANSTETIQILQDSERQINSIAIIHQMLYQLDDFSLINIDDYIIRLVAELKASYTNTNIEIKVAVVSLYLSSNIAVPLGLIISELVTNSYKHAFGDRNGEVFISINKNLGNDIVFEYRDNGQGFDAKYALENSKSMGLKLLQMLTEEIDGTINIDGQNGMQTTIKFKYNEN